MNLNKKLQNKQDKIAAMRIVVGYDGFVDTTARPLKQAAGAMGTDESSAFRTIREFGEFLVSKSGKSCSIELKVESSHLGGNAPFLSQAASSLGMDVSCIGMLGQGGEVDPVFEGLHCTKYPFAAPGQSTCLEFQDGKVMLAPSVNLADDGWHMVQGATTGQAAEILQNADLIALVNWSELAFAHKLWQDTYDQVLAHNIAAKDKIAFFDLCDFSRRDKIEIDTVLKLIRNYGHKRTTILSLNENEALLLSERILGEQYELEQVASKIRERYQIDEIIIHTLHQSLLANDRGVFVRDTIYVEHPSISTGAGDHFNGASCFAVLMGLEPQERLLFANCAASLYVHSGQTPTLTEIMAQI